MLSGSDSWDDDFDDGDDAQEDQLIRIPKSLTMSGLAIECL